MQIEPQWSQLREKSLRKYYISLGPNPDVCCTVGYKETQLVKMISTEFDSQFDSIIYIHLYPSSKD